MLLPQTESLIQEFVEQSGTILADNLVGVYLHGSAVMGCFNPEKSDLDFILVVKNPLSDEVKRRYMDMVVACSAQGPAKGIEMSVVLQNVCNPLIYPTPFELHFSEGHLDWYQADPDDYIRKMKGTDKDLAAHFMILTRRGRCLCGAPIPAVFGEVPAEAYLDSIWYDVEGAAEGIAEYPMYLTLNLARVLAWKEAGLVLSKKEGGEWAIKNLPERYHPLILDAMREYAENADIVYNRELAESFAEYALQRIRQDLLSAEASHIIKSSNTF